jgi:uncharacterized SAM-binding protein YcdF (DUF218 family)
VSAGGRLISSGLGAVVAALATLEILDVSRRAREDAGRIATAEAVIPLGYEITPGNEPTARYCERLNLATALWRQYRLPIWSLAGQLAHMERTIAWYSREYLVARGVDPAAIRILDDFPFLGESIETFQEIGAAIDVAQRIGVKRVALISDVVHLAQIAIMLRGSGLDPIYVPTSLTPAWNLAELRYLAVRVGIIPVTLADRTGQSLGWLRAWRRNRFGTVGTGAAPP